MKKKSLPEIIIPKSGEQLFHVWGGEQPPKTYALINMKRLEAARDSLRKKYGEIHLSIATAAVMPKAEISHFFI